MWTSLHVTTTPLPSLGCTFAPTAVLPNRTAGSRRKLLNQSTATRSNEKCYDWPPDKIVGDSQDQSITDTAVHLVSNSLCDVTVSSETATIREHEASPCNAFPDILLYISSLGQHQTNHELKHVHWVFEPQLVPPSKALYQTCFTCGQRCKCWSRRPKLTSSVISDVECIIYIFYIYTIGYVTPLN